MLNATEIFLGTLISCELDESIKLIKHEFTVEKRWKGPVNKTVTVWGDFRGEEGTKYLVIANMKDGLLMSGRCSVILPGLKFDKYRPTLEEILDSLVLLTIEQLKKLDGKIEAKVIKIGDTVIHKDEGMPWSDTIVVLDKGKKDGLYRGMEMCIPFKGAEPLQVIDVEEETAKAIFSTIISEYHEDIEIYLGMKVKSTIANCN